MFSPFVAPERRIVLFIARLRQFWKLRDFGTFQKEAANRQSTVFCVASSRIAVAAANHRVPLHVKVQYVFSDFCDSVV